MKKIIAANWKMNMTMTETKSFLKKIVPKIKNTKNDVILCLPFTNIQTLKNMAKNTKICIGAQNFYFEDKGAYTGEISSAMLKDVGVEYVIIGHSERREIFKEDDLLINNKVKKALKEKIIPILCVGESLKERQENKTFEKIKKQLANDLLGIESSQIKKIIIAYEPIWAIGTGKTATADEAEEVCKYIKDFIGKEYGESIKKAMKVLYGGSVNNQNAKELFKKENIDGGLIGGASLKLEFIDMVNTKY